MATLTPAIAADLMYRSMTTGVPTNEFFQYGGYNAVKQAYESSGGKYNLNEIPPDRKAELAQQVASTGQGNLAILAETRTPLNAQGIAAMAKQGFKAEHIQEMIDRFSYPAFSSNSTNNSSSITEEQYNALQSQLNDLQTRYDDLTSQYGEIGGIGTGGIVGGGVVDDGSSLNPGQNNIGTGGVVYGPDGKMYSSPAAAIAAGVTNFTYLRPQTGTGLIAGADTLNNPFLQPAANTGNANPGASIANQNQQLFEMGAPKVKLPGAVTNPFAVK